MRLVIVVVVSACVLAVGAWIVPQANSQPVTETSPHVDALRLVFAECGDRIQAVDAEYWWHDVKPRQWTAKRPFYPGYHDSTHLFSVSYEIDGKVVASWSVDTRAGTVQEVRTPATRPATTLPDAMDQAAE